MKPDLRIGVIGVSQRGRLADYAHKPGLGSRIVAGADINPAALDEFKKRISSDVFTTADYTELLARDDIDAVFILTPDYLHEQMSVEAARAGKHIYLEKPLAITVEGCDRILREVCKNKVKLYLGHNMRHMSFVLKMKELIDSGIIGEIQAAWCRHFVGHGGDFYYQDWHADRTKTTSLLLQKAAHDIDIMHWLAGGFTTRTVAMGKLAVYDKIQDRHDDKPFRKYDIFRNTWPASEQKKLNPIIDVEDISMMQMQLDNGVQCSYQQCHFTPDYWRNYCFIGTRGRIENFGDTPGSDCVIRVWKDKCNYNRDGDLHFTLPRELGSHGGADPKIVAEFIRYIREDGPVTTSPIAARQAVAAGYCATMSIRNDNMPFDVPPVDEDLLEYFKN